MNHEITTLLLDSREIEVVSQEREIREEVSAKGEEGGQYMRSSLLYPEGNGRYDSALSAGRVGWIWLWPSQASRYRPGPVISGRESAHSSASGRSTSR